MRNDKIKIQITEEEWAEFPPDKRERVKELLKEQYGYDIKSLIKLDDDGSSCPYCSDKGCEVCEEGS